MEVINLRYQITLFGGYDEIIPNSENMKFFIENFSSKGLIPNQVPELFINIGSKDTSPKTNLRLNLTDPERKWDIKFNSDKIEITFLNSNIGVVKEISKEDFVSEVVDFLGELNKKFSKSHKRIGFVSQYLFDYSDTSEYAKLFLNSIEFFSNKQISNWSGQTSTRMSLNCNDSQSEVVNVSSEIRTIKQPMNMNNSVSLFNGIVLNIDINTLSENSSYRFEIENMKSIFDEMSKIESTISDQIIQKFKQNE